MLHCFSITFGMLMRLYALTNLKAPASSTFPLEGEDEVPTVAAKLKLVELVAAVLGAVSNEEVAAIEVVVSGRASREKL